MNQNDQQQEGRNSQAEEDILSTLSATFEWFQRARPAPTNKQFHTQTGVHFEEVAEMVDEITPLTSEAEVLLHNAKVSLKALATYLKKAEGAITVLPEQRADFLDAICDQIVTATGVGQHLGFPVIQAMDEVNASNWSKFVDGQPIVDANQKIMKGPGFWKPDLTAYIPVYSPALGD